MPTNACPLITFKGEFPEESLIHMRHLAELLAPYEAMHGGTLTTEEEMTAFDLLEIDGCFTDAFWKELTLGAKKHGDFLCSLRERLTPKDLNRAITRFNRVTKRIKTDLLENGWPLTHRIFKEMNIAGSVHRFLGDLRAHGQATARKYFLDPGPAPTPPKGGYVDASMSVFQWFDIGSTHKGNMLLKADRIEGTDAARAMLRTVELEFAGPWVCIPFPYDIGKVIGLEKFEFFVGPSQSPLGVANIFLIDRVTRKIHTICTLSRFRGELTWKDSAFTSIAHVFNTPANRRVYPILRDIVVFMIYEMIMSGKLLEKTYIDDQRIDEILLEPPEIPEDTEEILPEQQSGQPADEVPRELKLESYEPIPVQDRAGKVGRGKLGWRNITMTLRRFGVAVSRQGKHYCLSKDGKSAPFLNPHKKHRPGQNKAVLCWALDTLGIPRAEFFKNL